MPTVEECMRCTKPCPQAKLANDIAVGRMYATQEVVRLIKEQEERSKGCEYCEDSRSVYEHKSELHDSMNEDVYISGNQIVVDIGCHSYGEAKINFCPMCGRKLSEPPKGE